MFLLDTTILVYQLVTLCRRVKKILTPIRDLILWHYVTDDVIHARHLWLEI